jgi:hypothetical protein
MSNELVVCEDVEHCDWAGLCQHGSPHIKKSDDCTKEEFCEDYGRKVKCVPVKDNK